jgi:hypothetical protein
MDKTHIEVPDAEISVRYLADYMAGSERKRRSIIDTCKYRPIARVLQHKEATLAISTALQNGPASRKPLRQKQISSEIRWQPATLMR